ncbi:MAG: hypothetical protein WD314_12500, partial [Trueperaceae bacterium]
GLGFDAYPEFAMHEGEQYARVRIGCFTTRDAAVSFARDLRGRVTADAVAQPLGSRSAPRACLEWDPGFVKPAQWHTVRRGSDIVFRVERGGQVGYVQHDGERWLFDHSLAAEPAPAAAGGARFRQVDVAGVALVQVGLADGTALNVCGGRLLWQHGLVAVVERASTVIACVVNETFPDDGP